MVRFLEMRGGRLDERTTRQNLLFWYVQSGTVGRFSAPLKA